ncbi:MAG TPA: ribokinase [Myxococcales bacterium]|nr:ribokinase [Myxococcales bacterium]
MEGAGFAGDGPEPKAEALVYDVVVVGKANVDYLARGPNLPGPGEGVNGDAFQEACGGKGANQAVGAARLGARVALVARIGTDARGEMVLAALRGEGVDTGHVSRDPAERTGVALCHVDARGQKQILSALGANSRLHAACVRDAADALRSARVVLTQLGVPFEAFEEAVRIGRAGGAKIVLDPAPGLPLPDALLSALDVIRPNALEAHALTGIRVRDRSSAREAAAQLLRRGAKAAAVQAGSEGDVLLWAGGECWLPRLDVPRVDVTGAGDAFASTLAVSLAEGKPLDAAGRFASAAAALATTALGAQASLPTRAAVNALLEKNRHE